MNMDARTKHFFEYEGASVCPKDFDGYWKDALKEADALDYNAEFSRKDFSS